jgi:hypothetical protein
MFGLGGEEGGVLFVGLGLIVLYVLPSIITFRRIA